MKKFVNHVSHVAWISRPENLAANVAAMESLSGAKLTRFAREDMGFAMHISWEAGLEIVAPLAMRTGFNRMLHDWLEIRGEGVFSVVFGVSDIERHRARVEALNYVAGPLMHDRADSPWHDKLPRYDSSMVLRDGDPATIMNTCFILGDIDYADGVVAFEDAR